MKRSLGLLITLVFILGGAFVVARFFTENAEPMQLEFWTWRTKEIQKGYLAGIIFLFGILVSGILTLSTVLSKTFEVARLRREVQALQRLLDQQSKAI
jgi:lysylphosphatidylglycerol synthetase-like protein (DUF2156 family)